VVAEGIETEQVYDLLNQMGCDIGQGYFMSKAMRISEFMQWQENSSWTMTGEQAIRKKENKK